MRTDMRYQWGINILIYLFEWKLICIFSKRSKLFLEKGFLFNCSEIKRTSAYSYKSEWVVFLLDSLCCLLSFVLTWSYSIVTETYSFVVLNRDVILPWPLDEVWQQLLLQSDHGEKLVWQQSVLWNSEFYAGDHI